MPQSRASRVPSAIGFRTEGGLPLAVFQSLDDAVALAETEPPTWDVQFPTGGGQWALEVGDCFVLYKGLWTFPPDEETPPELIPSWKDFLKKRILVCGACPLDTEQLNRLTNNVLVALTQRPECITVTNRRPSPKAARKRGRRYFPGVEYVIGSTASLWKGNEENPVVNEATPRTPPEGWTLSVRTMVRGHWRRLAVRRGLAEGKVTWIRPHWRGPDDAPISAHATRLAGPRSSGSCGPTFMRLVVCGSDDPGDQH